MTSHRGGFGKGPTHAISSSVTTSGAVDAYRRRGTAGGIVSSPPAHVAPPRVRRTKDAASEWCPPWVRKMVTEKATVEEVVRTAIKRAVGDPTEDNLVEVQTLLNELAKDPEAARHVRAIFGEHVVSRHLSKGAKS